MVTRAARPCVVCGKVAVADHHVVAACHSPNTVIPVCREHHAELDSSLYYAGVHRRNRSTTTPVDRDYALVRGVSDVHLRLLRAGSNDSRLIELFGRAQYALAQHVAAEVAPQDRIGPQPPTSGVFEIKTGRLRADRPAAHTVSMPAPDWLDRLRVVFSMSPTLIADYGADPALAGCLSEIADGLANDRLRAWVGSYQTEASDEIAETLRVDLAEYVDALLAHASDHTSDIDVSERLAASVQVVAAHVESVLALLLGISRSQSEHAARAAVDGFIAGHGRT